MAAITLGDTWTFVRTRISPVSIVYSSIMYYSSGYPHQLIIFYCCIRVFAILVQTCQSDTSSFLVNDDCSLPFVKSFHGSGSWSPTENYLFKLQKGKHCVMWILKSPVLPWVSIQSSRPRLKWFESTVHARQSGWLTAHSFNFCQSCFNKLSN